MTEPQDPVLSAPEVLRTAGDGFGPVLRAVGAQTGEIQALRGDLKTFSDRWKWARWVMIACFLVGLAGVGFGLFARRDAHDAQRAAVEAAAAAAKAQTTADDIVTNRTSSRIINCKDANTFGAFHNALLVATENILRSAAEPSPSRTPEEQAQVERFVNANIASLEKTRVAERDCSPDAVNKYYDGTDSPTG